MAHGTHRRSTEVTTGSRNGGEDGRTASGAIQLEIDTVADLYQVGYVVPAEVREAVLGTNWLDFPRFSLPQSS